MFLKKWLISSALCWLVSTTPAWALQERHLVVIHHAEAENNVTHVYNSNPGHTKYKPASLTEKGRQQAKKTAELLLTYGFDNRNIAAVYVSPLPRALETAHILASIGVFDKNKIHPDPRMLEVQAGMREGLPQTELSKDNWLIGVHEAKAYRGESNADVRQRILAIYDDVEKKYEKGHVLFITHGVPAMELIDEITHTKVKLKTAQVYLMPLSKRYALG